MPCLRSMTSSRALRKAALWLLAALVLALVFALYLQPQFAIAVLDQVWACF